jgi:hypothetical protein
MAVRTISNNNKVRCVFYLERETIRKIKQESNERGISNSAIVRKRLK